MVKVFKSPDEHPNALEATPDALWVGGQVSEIAYKVDWNTHKVLHQVQTESHNTSGMAVGGGYLWMSANGGVSNPRPARPTDFPYDEIVQCDLEDGKNDPAVQAAMAGRVTWHRLGRANQHGCG